MPTATLPSVGATLDAANALGQSASKQTGVAFTPYSPTVVSDANIRENVIPSTMAKANTMLPPNPHDQIGYDPTTDPNSSAYKENGDLGDPSSPSFYDDMVKSISGAGAGEDEQEKNLILGQKTGFDQGYDSLISSIHDQFQSNRADMQQEQNARSKQIENVLSLGGSTRYAPISSSGIMSAKDRYDMQSLNDLASKEKNAVAQALTAKNAGDMQLLDKQLGIIDRIRKQKTDLATKVSDSMAAANKATREAKIQSSRDGAVADLVEQGLTDPNQILSALNANGGDFTAEQVQKTLKALDPNGNLSGSIKDFYTLKGRGMLPESISGLPDDEQFFAYLHQQKAATTISSGSKGTKITLANVKALGLPLSIVGRSQDDILKDLQSQTPPEWFIEKLNTETNSETEASNPNTMEMWDEYRAKAMGKAEGAKDEKETATHSKATQYFHATYDGLSDEDVDQIAQEVETYVNGGMSYADAIEQTEKDLNE